MAAAQQEIPKEIWMKDVPKEGIILIKRFANPFVTDQKYQHMVLGERSATGPFTIKGKKVETGYGLTSRVAIRSEVMMLDLSIETRRDLFAILSLTDQFKSLISADINHPQSGSVYYFENPEMEAKTWQANKNREIELMNSIKGLGAEGLRRAALFFSIKGSVNLVEVNLLKKAETIEGRKELMDYLWSPDRTILELISLAESKADTTKKLGLWKNPLSGIYHWNNMSIGLGKEAVIVYLKKEQELQYEMRKLYMSEAEANEAPKIQPKTEPKHPGGFNPDMNQMKADYEAGMDFTEMGKKYHRPDGTPSHHFTLRKLLKDAGVEIKKK